MKNGIRLAMAILLLAATTTVWSGCANAGLKAKQDILIGLQVNETALGAFQDAEKAAYDSHAVAALTSDVHKHVSAALSHAFEEQIKLGTALKAWKSGDPAPASVTALIDDAQAAYDAVSPLVPAAPQMGDTFSKLRTWLNEIVALAKQFNVTLPPWLATATAGGVQ